MSILVTGGAGYIGSHTCVELLNAGYEVVALDNLCNSHAEAINRVQHITGKKLRFLESNVCDRVALENALSQYKCSAVIHFAGLKAVGESIEKPLAYYSNNVFGTLSLLQAMHAVGVKTLVFSSSATVYGEPRQLPIREDHPLSVTNPYGRTKLIIEDMLRDLYRATPSWRIAILRYFNPVGAHKSGLIGEDPIGIPNNLMPSVAKVAIGRLKNLTVLGNDYPTPDGTGIRDYIHVTDLAIGHIHALRKLTEPQCFEVNLGTGVGYSVLEVIKAFEATSGREIPYAIQNRRSGDVASCYADPSRAHTLLQWRATRGIEQMCADAWRWQVNNPYGYRSNSEENS